MSKSTSSQKVTRLQKLDTVAWSQIFEGVGSLVPLAVERVQALSSGSNYTRYQITLEGHSDPVTVITKKTTVREAQFLQNLAVEAPTLAPRALFVHVGKRSGWVVLADAPHDRPLSEWQPGDVIDMVGDLASFHAHFWARSDEWKEFDWLPFVLGTRRRSAEKKIEKPASFESGLEIKTISKHALNSAQELAPVWEEAAEGLRTLLDLNGWDGVIEEKQLRAVADLIDDPLPMLHRLRQLPVTLLHGYPGTYNWRVSCLDTRTLVDWQATAIGPGIYDLVTFLETFWLIQAEDGGWQTRDNCNISEETIIDNYILRLTNDLDGDIDAIALRRAIPAARCLYIILHWFPRFNKWFRDLPEDEETRLDMWQQIAEFSEEELSKSMYRPIAGLRPYLAETFKRFLRSYYQIS